MSSEEEDNGMNVSPSMIDFSPIENEIKYYLYEDKYSESFQKCVELLKLDPENQVANKTLEIIGSRDGKLDERLRSIFEEGHKLVQDNKHEEALATFSILKNLFLVGNPVATESSDGGEYLKDSVTGAFAWSGLCRLQVGDPEKAIKEYNVVIDRAKKVVAGWVINRGTARLEAGRVRKAMLDLDKGLEADPDNVSGLISRGHVYYKMNEVQKAKEDWERAEELGSDEAARLLNDL